MFRSARALDIADDRADLLKQYQPHDKMVTESGTGNWLHYRVTALALLATGIFVELLDLVGVESSGNISCIFNGPKDSWKIAEKVINSYCYVQQTFILPNTYPNVRDNTAGQSVGYLGVGRYNYEDDDNKNDVQRIWYYPWVSVVLIVQAASFYLPHIVLKMLDGNKLKKIVVALATGYNFPGLRLILVDSVERQGEAFILGKYFITYINKHNVWAVKLLLVDILYLVNVVGNIFIINWLLDFQNPSPEFFPKVTKCELSMYGPSGTVQRRDAMCLLPLNIVNERIYPILWVWLPILAIVTAISIIYQTVVTFSPAATRTIIELKQWLNGIPLTPIIKDNWRTWQCLQFGDWRLIYKLEKNMEPMLFQRFIHELHCTYKIGTNNFCKMKPVD